MFIEYNYVATLNKLDLNNNNKVLLNLSTIFSPSVSWYFPIQYFLNILDETQSSTTFRSQSVSLVNK
jgi:hypothetical protein